MTKLPKNICYKTRKRNIYLQNQYWLLIFNSQTRTKLKKTQIVTLLKNAKNAKGYNLGKGAKKRMTKAAKHKSGPKKR